MIPPKKDKGRDKIPVTVTSSPDDESSFCSEVEEGSCPRSSSSDDDSASC